MTAFRLDKFRTIVTDGNLSLLSNAALEAAAVEVRARQTSKPGQFPEDERDEKALADLEAAISQEKAARTESSAA